MENGKEEQTFEVAGNVRVIKDKNTNQDYYIPILVFTLPTEHDGMVDFAFEATMFTNNEAQAKELLRGIFDGFNNIVKTQELPVKAGNA